MPSQASRIAAFRRACKIGCLETVVRLVADGIDVDRRDRHGLRPIHHAAERGHLGVLQVLVEKGSVLNAVLDDASPLHHACEVGDQQTCRALLDAGAAVDWTDIDGCTALVGACANGHLPVVRMLLQAGADVNLADAEGVAALYAATFWKFGAIVRRLLGNGADVTHRTATGQTVLQAACRGGVLATVTDLIHAQAMKAETDGSALYLACKNGHTAVVALLVRTMPMEWLGTVCTSKRQTSLYTACRYGHEDIVALLVARGADVNAETSSGRTPLHVACRYDRESIARVLLRAGAHVRRARHCPVAVAARAWSEGRAAFGSAARMILEASAPWSTKTHRLFASDARAHAVALVVVGQQIADQIGGAGIAEVQSFVDAWIDGVMPHLVARGR
jgi:ankyrin repeat protein